MTIEDLSNLSDEELRVMCAEARGWRMVEGVYAFPPPDEIKALQKLFPNLAAVDYREIPNYPADLNAMHEAEKILSGPEWLGYMSFLEPMAEDNGPGFMIHATARQRCIAFILTMQQS